MRHGPSHLAPAFVGEYDCNPLYLISRSDLEPLTSYQLRYCREESQTCSKDGCADAHSDVVDTRAGLRLI